MFYDDLFVLSYFIPKITLCFTININYSSVVMLVYLNKHYPCLGDEIFSVNGRSVAGLTHQEAIAIFKEVKLGPVHVALGRRDPQHTVLSICE
jgi:hypothetical protein